MSALASPNPSPYPEAGHLDPSPSPSPSRNLSPNPSPDQALTLLGVPMPPEEADALFGACDAEGGGVLPCRKQAGPAVGQLALRRPLSAPDHASGGPKPRAGLGSPLAITGVFVPAQALVQGRRSSGPQRGLVATGAAPSPRSTLREKEVVRASLTLL